MRCMEMAYRDRWRAEIAELQKILSGFDLREECKWGKPCYTMDGKNVVIIQGFKEYCALCFFQGALLKDPKKLLVQLGQIQAARVDEVHQPEGDCDEGGHHQGLRARGRGGREGRNEGRDEAPRASRARGVEGEVPQRSGSSERSRRSPRVGKGDTCFTSPT